MTASLYSPWGPQNLPARSPQPIIVIPVRCKCQPNAFRIRIPAKPQAKAAPRQGNSRERFVSARRIAVPALFSRGPFGRTLNLFGSNYQAIRSLFTPRLQPSKQSGSGIFETFKWLLRFVVHTEQHTEESEGNVPKSTGEIRNVEC